MGGGVPRLVPSSLHTHAGIIRDSCCGSPSGGCGVVWWLVQYGSVYFQSPREWEDWPGAVKWLMGYCSSCLPFSLLLSSGKGLW